MSGGLRVSGVGRLGGDPELRFTASGAQVVSVSAAFTVRVLDKNTQQWTDKSTTWARLNIWRQMAENVAASLSKGDSVFVEGTAEVREYDRPDGSKGSSLEILVDTIGPDLRFQQAGTSRPERSGPGAGGNSAPPSEDPWAEPHDSRNRPAAGPRHQPGQARQGQWSNGQSTTAQGSGFADEPPF